MSDNSSTSHLSSLRRCLDSKMVTSIFYAFTVTKLFIMVPLAIVILYLGYQRWRQKCSFATTSHTDIFTYHVAAIQMIYALGTMVLLCGQYTGVTMLVIVGFYATSIGFPGEMFFNTVTCVERYLAVVHPITYLGLRQSGGAMIRNISTGCIWLLCLGWLGVTYCYFHEFLYISYFVLFIFSLVTVSFCSISVLCVLIRPGPGGVEGDRQRVDEPKQKAFYTITVIMGVLVLYCFWVVFSVALKKSNLLSLNDECVMLTCVNWISMPSSLILPLLFLHRAGKLFCCHCSNH